MHTKLPCGCSHNDTHWLSRCAACAAVDTATNERWANDRANPPKIKVHRINGVLQGDIYQEVAAKILQEPICPEPALQLTNGSNSASSSESSEQIDYSKLLSLL